MGGKGKETGNCSGADLYFYIYQLLKRREELEDFALEYKKIDTALKEYFSGVPNFVIGEYAIRGGWAAAFDKRPPQKTWDITIKNIKDSKNKI